jgi:hypothetical protein
MSVSFRSVGPASGTAVEFNTGTGFAVPYPANVQASDICVLQVIATPGGTISVP